MEALEPLAEVLEHYDFEVSSIKNESYKGKKGVWWIKTLNGYKVLKKMSNSEETIKYILSAVRHLSENGILIPKINKTSTGEEYVKVDETCYILSDAIEGKNPSYSSEKELAIIVKELAKFHKASKGFVPITGTKPRIHLNTWIRDYSNEIENMNIFYKEELNRQSSIIGEVIVKEFPYFYDRAQKVIKELSNQEYTDWVDKISKEGGLCHQDFAAGNLILTPLDELFVLDIDSITIDIPARDIRKLINKIMKKKGKWDLELTKNILSYYQSENPLTPSQWKVVKLDLLFPHLFMGAMNKFYYQRDKDWTPEKYLNRIKGMALFGKSIEPVAENFDALIPS